MINELELRKPYCKLAGSELSNDCEGSSVLNIERNLNCGLGLENSDWNLN